MEPPTEKQKMLAGEAYRPDDPELSAERHAAALWMARYNTSFAMDAGQRLILLRQGIAEAGMGSEIRPPFYCDYGYNIRIGARVFLNFNCVVLDVAPVEIGDGTMIGPAVQILTADHPRDAAARRAGFESGQSILIGRDVWIGGGAIILPGVTIGDEAIIGAGSIVTRDIPAGVVAIGNPARQQGSRRSSR